MKLPYRCGISENKGCLQHFGMFTASAAHLLERVPLPAAGLVTGGLDKFLRLRGQSHLAVNIVERRQFADCK